SLFAMPSASTPTPQPATGFNSFLSLHSRLLDASLVLAAQPSEHPPPAPSTRTSRHQPHRVDPGLADAAGRVATPSFSTSTVTNRRLGSSVFHDDLLDHQPTTDFVAIRSASGFSDVRPPTVPRKSPRRYAAGVSTRDAETAMNKKDPQSRQAFREKLASCIVIALLMTLVAFETFGMQLAWCPASASSSVSDAALNQSDHTSIAYRDDVVIFGYIFDFTQVQDLLFSRIGTNITADWHGRDISLLFRPTVDNCESAGLPSETTCSVPNPYPGSSPLEPANGYGCPSAALLDALQPTGRLYFTWDDVTLNSGPPHSLAAFNGLVLNLSRPLSNPSAFGLDPDLAAELAASAGSDATLRLSGSWSALAAAGCLAQRAGVGFVERETPGCTLTRVIQAFCLVVILALILVRFFLAVAFHWFMSERAVRPRIAASTVRAAAVLPRTTTAQGGGSMALSCPFRLSLSGSEYALARDLWTRTPRPGHRIATEDDPFCILLVTCYSEDEAGIRGTLESLASSAFPDTHKLLFVVADGLITGAGNTRSTPDAVISMIDVAPALSGSHDRKSYIAVAEGTKSHNMARVYGGHYNYAAGGSVPILAVIKCGTESEEAEEGQKRSGNRGKRDSQLILMKFLQSVMTPGQPMTALDYELARQLQVISGVRPEAYEVVLMVDADTVVAPDALQHMVHVLLNDPGVMGLCGETRIENKRDSWVTKIQVFEYYISHHLGKAFESVFGGVTCLPGCFCLYRIKARRPGNPSALVPLLASADIISEYSVAQVDTLHKKNLLCLGEDRFLTTLMLHQFPKRKLVFVPRAICFTTVPADFKTLLSQRRRWINSTIHNLLELVMMKNLCGVFCFSMQFMILLDLIGTAVLPASVTLMFVLIISCMAGQAAVVPLMTLLATLGLPAVLILITTQEVEFISWMLIYLAALPIWNFVLPLYAFWHLDDVSWGQTRIIEGDNKGAGGHSEAHGDYVPGAVTFKTFEQWSNMGRPRMLGTTAAATGPSATVHEVAESLARELGRVTQRPKPGDGVHPPTLPLNGSEPSADLPLPPANHASLLRGGRSLSIRDFLYPYDPSLRLLYSEPLGPPLAPGSAAATLLHDSARAVAAANAATPAVSAAATPIQPQLPGCWLVTNDNSDFPQPSVATASPPPPPAPWRLASSARPRSPPAPPPRRTERRAPSGPASAPATALQDVPLLPLAPRRAAAPWPAAAAADISTYYASGPASAPPPPQWELRATPAADTDAVRLAPPLPGFLDQSGFVTLDHSSLFADAGDVGLASRAHNSHAAQSSSASVAAAAEPASAFLVSQDLPSAGLDATTRAVIAAVPRVGAGAARARAATSSRSRRDAPPTLPTLDLGWIDTSLSAVVPAHAAHKDDGDGTGASSGPLMTSTPVPGSPASPAAPDETFMTARDLPPTAPSRRARRARSAIPVEALQGGGQTAPPDEPSCGPHPATEGATLPSAAPPARPRSRGPRPNPFGEVGR
ncbi:hypothetical protein HK405_008904, partial [Cladochytrium tenue]